MGIIYILVLLLLIFILLVFTAVLRVAFLLDTERETVSLTLLWLYPFLKVIVESNASVPVLTVFFFNKALYKKSLMSGKSGSKMKGTGLIRATTPEDIRVDASYGFRDPFVTGLACGAVSAASLYTNLVSIKQNPDFSADSDFICMNATARIKLGSTLINYMRKRNRSKS